MESLISIENLCVDYRVREGWLSAVNGVTFDVGKGEIFALVGESGCGKSTIAYTIMRLFMDGNSKVTGKVEFEGRDLLQATDAQMEQIRGSEIGMIFQNPLDSLNPVYRSGRQVQEAILLDRTSRAEAWERVLALYRDVRIPDPERRSLAFPHELSGGMRQRVMIAMMLARKPQLLIADEPTTALDVTVEAQILAIMKTLRDELGASILLITHNFGIVAQLADRVGIMYAGELIEVGNVFDIFSDPRHPYSKALLSALPRIRKSKGRIESIEGSVPRIIGEFEGCRFSNRCPAAAPVCRTAAPAATNISDSHYIRCHHNPEGDEPGKVFT